MVGADPIEVFLIKTAFEQTPLITRGALLLEWTSVTGRCIALIAFLTLGIRISVERQDGIVGTDVDITLRIVSELVLSVEGCAVIKIWQRYISPNVLVFKRDDIVSGRLTRPQFPAEAGTPQQIEHRLVFHNLRGSYQHGHDNPRLASIHHIVGVVAQMASLPFGGHDGGIWVGRTDHEVGHAPIGSPNDLPIWFSHPEGPVMTLLICLRQLLSESIFNENRKWDGGSNPGFADRGGRRWYLARWHFLFTDRLWRRGSSFACGEGWLCISSTLWPFFPFCGEESSQMFLDRKARLDRLHRGIGIHFGSVNIELFSPDQLLLLALLHNGLKEATEDIDSIALTNTGQTGMIGQWLAQIVSDVPSDAEPICCVPHQLPFGAYPLEEHHELQLEEDDGINRGTTTTCIGLMHKLADKRKIKCPLQATVEVVLRNQLF